MNKKEVKEIIETLDAQKENCVSMSKRIRYLHSMVRLAEQSANLDGQKKEMESITRQIAKMK